MVWTPTQRRFVSIRKKSNGRKSLATVPLNIHNDNNPAAVARKDITISWKGDISYMYVGKRNCWNTYIWKVHLEEDLIPSKRFGQ
jgi:hypothetical protein